ncbi:MAG: hypothetical protein ACREI2_11885 [Nitrospiraceae bacterium]
MGPFATATEFFEVLGLPVPDDMARIQALLDSASAKIRGAGGQVYSQVLNDVIELGPTSARSLYLPEHPVTAITQILVKGVSVLTKIDFTALGRIVHGATPADYSLEGWPDGATVTYTHGYAETDEKFKQIKSICIEAAAEAFLHDPSQSGLLGGAVAETVGWIPRVFLTQEHKSTLMGLGMVGVG